MGSSRYSVWLGADLQCHECVRRVQDGMMTPAIARLMLPGAGIVLGNKSDCQAKGSCGPVHLSLATLCCPEILSKPSAQAVGRV